MKIRPARGKAFVRLHKDEAKTAGGLFVPEAVRGDKSDGTVIAVGPGKILPNGVVVEPDVGEGDVVILPKYTGSEVKPPPGWEEEGEGRMLVVDTDEILAVWEK